jgi:nitrogen fixation protein FixH
MSAARAQVRGWHVLAAILGFFGVVIAVNAAFIVLAVQSFPGEDVRRSYLQGLHYNDTLAERRAQAALGWRADATLTEGSRGAAIEITLRDHVDAPVEGATLEASLQWPTAARRDRALLFEEAGGGRYVAHVGELMPGRWRLRGRAERAEGALDFESELTWRSR